MSRKTEKLRRFILTSFRNDDIATYPTRRVVVLGGNLEVTLEEEAIDRLARESGLVVGKWLIYASPENIDDVWKTIASSTLRNELGVDAKVSTVSQAQRECVVCVYTRNYLDVDDVKRVRKKLTELGFTNRLFYKPDIYTYLKSTTRPSLTRKPADT